MTIWQIAGVRAVGTAIGTGCLTALTTWSQTSDPKTIAIAGLTAALTIILARFGIEGTVDSRTSTKS